MYQYAYTMYHMVRPCQPRVGAECDRVIEFYRSIVTRMPSACDAETDADSLGQNAQKLAGHKSRAMTERHIQTHRIEK